MITGLHKLCYIVAQIYITVITRERDFCKNNGMGLDERHIGLPVWRLRRESDIIIF